MSIFGENCRHYRKLLKLTQEDVAKKVAISQPSYALMESGKRDPDTDTVLKIATALEVTPDKLFGINSKPRFDIPDRVRQRLSHLTDEQIEDLIDNIVQQEEDSYLLIKQDIQNILLPKLNCNVGMNDFGEVIVDDLAIEKHISTFKLLKSYLPTVSIKYKNGLNLFLYYTTRNMDVHVLTESRINFTNINKYMMDNNSFVFVFIVNNLNGISARTFVFNKTTHKMVEELSNTLLSADEYTKYN